MFRFIRKLFFAPDRKDIEEELSVVEARIENIMKWVISSGKINIVQERKLDELIVQKIRLQHALKRIGE